MTQYHCQLCDMYVEARDKRDLCPVCGNQMVLCRHPINTRPNGLYLHGEEMHECQENSKDG